MQKDIYKYPWEELLNFPADILCTNIAFGVCAWQSIQTANFRSIKIIHFKCAKGNAAFLRLCLPVY